MTLLGLRAEISDDRPERLVRRFFDSLGHGRYQDAESLVAKDFEWFGDKVSRERWREAALGAIFGHIGMRAGEVRRLSLELIRAMPKAARQRCLGGAADRDAVVLADVVQGAHTVTVVAVTDRRQLLRVLDPAKLLSFVRYAAVLHHLRG